MGAAIVVILVFAAVCAFPLLVALGGSPTYPADPAARAQERMRRNAESEHPPPKPGRVEQLPPFGSILAAIP